MWEKTVIFFIPSLILGWHLNPTGPKHEFYALSCLMELSKNNFFYLNERDQVRNDVSTLLTVMLTDNMTSPAFEIQQNFIQNLNHFLQWNIEVINNAFVEFHEEIEISVALDTFFYVIIVDNMRNFEAKLHTLLDLNNFNSYALFLVYFAGRTDNYTVIAMDILLKLKEKMILNCIVAIPENLTNFNVYNLDLYGYSQSCLKNPQLQLINTCHKGKLNKNENHFIGRFPNNFANCKIVVIAVKVLPFVINAKEGFEIELLQLIGNSLQIDFIVKLTDDFDWGSKINGTWTNALGEIYKNAIFGVGNIGVSPDMLEDFDFSIGYFTENLVWIVPIAPYVPEWRVLVTIFIWEIWTVCLCTILICGILLYASSRFAANEFTYYKQFGSDCLIAYQLIITSSVFLQPKSSLSRIIFLGLAVFSIIISSVYTSSLINYLTNLRRDTQISTIDGILASNLEIGGFDPDTRDIFNGEDDEKEMEIYEKFKIDGNLTAINWLNRVANGTSCTVYSEFYVKFLMTKGYLIDGNGRPNVYIFKNNVFSYNIHIVMKRGYPLRNKFNVIIRNLLNGGFINSLANKYKNFGKIEEMEANKDVVQKLNIRQLQGAFAVLVLGYITGGVVLLLELFVFCIYVKF